MRSADIGRDRAFPIATPDASNPLVWTVGETRKLDTLRTFVTFPDQLTAAFGNMRFHPRG
jgi:hypothetical protein